MSKVSIDTIVPIYCAMGFITTQWALIEFIIDTCVAIIYNEYDGNNKTSNKQIPRSLIKKIPFFRKCLREIPELKPFLNDGLQLIDRINILSKQRHDIIHSAISRINPKSIDLSKLDYGNELHKFRKLNFTHV